MREYDLVVIGAGSGGIAAVESARRRKKSVLLVEQNRIGGDCTFTGCVPSKALIEQAAKGAGFDQAMAHVRRAVEVVAAAEDDRYFTTRGIEVIHERASFLSPNVIDLGGTRVHGRSVIIAAGARPAVAKIDGIDDISYLTNENVFDLKTLPQSLVILGGGPIGCELAQAFRRFGTAVTLVHSGDRLLPKDDPDASAVVLDVFRREGIDVRLQVRARSVAMDNGGVEIKFANRESVSAEQLLVATGRQAATDGLRLDAAGIECDKRGFIKTDGNLQTTQDNHFAVGDIGGKLQFTHAAYEMGNIAVKNAFSHRKQGYDSQNTPWVTFTSPEVAHIGMNEQQVAEHGGEVAYLPMTELDRAIAADETDGFIKLITGNRRVIGGVGGGKLLGATIVCSRAGELISEVALAMRTDVFPGRLAQTVHAYPTWSMGVQQAAAQFFFEIGGRTARAAQSTSEAKLPDP